MSKSPHHWEQYLHKFRGVFFITFSAPCHTHVGEPALRRVISGAARGNAMPYSQLAKDAIEDWVGRAGDITADVGNARKIDEKCTTILQALRDECLDFSELNVDETVAFLLTAYPRLVLYELGRRESRFLRRYAEFWKPRANEWVVALYRYCGYACNFFGMVLKANCGVIGGLNASLGRALVIDLPCVPFGSPIAAVQSAFGSLIEHTGIKNLARWHEDQMNRLTRKMSPEHTGFAYRHLLFYRARPNTCKCGWAPLEASCKCALDLEYDPCKEYATCLYQIVCARRSGKFDALDRNVYQDFDGKNYNTWGAEEKLRFIMAASQYILSDVTFAEICKNMDLTQSPPCLAKPRKLTSKESRANFVKSFAQHGGCQHTSCKAIAKQDCANVSCKKHCRFEGILPCTEHKHSGASLPKISENCPIPPQEILQKVGEAQAPITGGIGTVRIVT